MAGKRRETATQKRMKSATEKLRQGREKAGRRLTQRACTQCDPTEWVRIADWEIHRSNYHRPGGYQFEQRKARAEQAKAAQKAQAEAAKQAAKAPPARPPRQPSKTKPTAASTRGKPTVASNGSGQWTSPFAGGRPDSGKQVGQQQAAAQQQASTSVTESIVETFRLWALQTPPSIPASRVDAQAAADMWRGIADALRARVRAEQENNKIPEKCTEPLLQAAQIASQIGDQHQEVVRRIQLQYGATAELLARPDTPDVNYLKSGV